MIAFRHYWRPRFFMLVLGLLLLLNSGISGKSPVASVEAQTLPDPSVEYPPTYFRSQDWFFKFFLRGNYETREPLNMVVYGPPNGYKGFSYGQVSKSVEAAVREIRVTPRDIAVLPERETTQKDDHKWLDIQPPNLWRKPGAYDFFSGEGLASGNYGECVFLHRWSPTRTGSPETLPVQSRAFATTQCPAIFGSIAEGYFELPDFPPEPEFLAGVRERNRFRIWDYDLPGFQFGINAAYIATSYEENFAIPGRCESTNSLPGGAHCVTDLNDSRDDLRRDIVAGANQLQWKVVAEKYDLLDQYTYTNNEPGPYLPGSPATDAGSVAPTIPGRGKPWSADGKVAVLCLDEHNTDYCDKRPAERPLVFNKLTPPNGSEVDGFGRQIFQLETGYSDERRAVKPPVYTIEYPATDGSTKTIEAAGELQGSDNGGKSQWRMTIDMPSDIQFNDVTGTAQANVRIKACDNGDQIYNAADAAACWTYKDVTYVLRKRANVFIVAPEGDTSGAKAWQARATTLADMLNQDNDKYRVTTRGGVTQLRQTNLTNVSVLVLMGLPLQSPDPEILAKVKDFLNSGRAVLIVGEHRYASSTLTGLYALSSELGLQFGTSSFARSCRSGQKAVVSSGVLGIPEGSEVFVAGANTVSGGLPVLKINDQTIAVVNDLAPGLIAGVGDGNVWGGCERYNTPAATNRTFTSGLFDWLTRRVR